MKNLVKIRAILSVVALAACAGCNTTRIGADPVALGTSTTTTYIDGDTNRVASVTTTPVHAFGWWANSYRNLMDTQIADMAFQYGEASASVHGYGNTVNVEAVKACADAVSDITAKVCAAIVSHGGTTVSSAVSSLVSRFVKAGGDASKATVSCTDGNCTITDGTITCDGGKCWE
ncbi:MAG: hypothetical protein IIY62_00660 [Kiritimatiellae bacterium]|nr:hypothetical protein [Kiritimatiellia bacterium]